jgi:hypothetical protein
MKSLHKFLRGLIVDTKRLHPEVNGLDRDFVTLEARHEDEGDGFLSVALPNLGKSLDLGILHGRYTCPDGFARIRGGTIPRLFSGMFCVVFDSKTGAYRHDCPPDVVKTLRQILYVFKKLAPSDEVNKRLLSSAKSSFIENDKSIRSIAPFRLDHISRICNLVLLDLDEFQELDCKHGPGAVAEGYSANQKWKAFYSSLSDLDSKLVSSGYDVVSYLHRDREPLFLCNTHKSDVARFVAVPKSSTSLRAITVEPYLNQFVQQGLNAHLRNKIEHCSVMSNCLTLTTQEPNQKLALEGSRTGAWVTVDLSSASDLLSTSLVECVFANRPRYLSALLSCRTPSVNVDKHVVNLQKYAGMGNATTFPVQSCVFALVALASMIPLHKRVTIKELAALALNIHVFGDDIIIKREYYSGFADWISSCGLVINRKKTFFKGDFRESCGVDAYKGYDVTPVYLRHDPDNASTEAESFVGVLSTCNQLWLQGMYSSSEVLRGQLGQVPLVPRSSSGFGLHTRQDARTYQRWSSSLHRFECRTFVPSVVRRKDILDGMPALMKFFHSPRSAEFDSNHLQSSVRKFNLNLRKRWVPSA